MGLGAAARVLVLLLARRPVSIDDGNARVDEPDPVLGGGVGELSVTILDEPVLDAPLELRLWSDTVVIPENRLSTSSIVDRKARRPRVRARFIAPREPGEYEVFGALRYITCVDDRCRPRTTTLRWTISVVDHR